ncbi:MAG: DEAD/DEAH box helicase, partial [Betaproteobacteria bacterium]|nr:DEAD/DEAH box helicase [Betaproteobacteria bacterium]
MHFNQLGLSAELLRAVAEQGYDTPTPIQSQAIPAVLAGRDLMATAQTGTGKTAGFTLPILQRLIAGNRDRLSRVARAPRVLVLVPTRELAMQVEESVRTYGKYVPVSSTVVFGGVGINPQIAALRRGVDIVVATPGRLLDHVQQHTVDLSAIEVFVLDEADRMLDMGFIRDIKKIIALLPAKRQNLLFSATFSPEIRELAAGLLDKPQSVDVAPRN